MFSNVKGWTFVRLAALAEEDETHDFVTPCGWQRFTRRAGEALHPEHWSAPSLRARRDEITNYDFSAQFQQRPTPVEGKLINPAWLQSRFELATFQRGRNDLYQSWDTAMKSGELNDYSVCTVWVLANHCFFLIDVFRRKLAYPDLREAVIALAERDRPTEILIEDKASGTPLIQDLQSAMVWSIKGITPPSGIDKMMRFRAQTPLFAQGRIYLPLEAPWLAEYIDEIVTFPGRHDDQVDSTSQALEHMRGISEVSAMWEKLAED